MTTKDKKKAALYITIGIIGFILLTYHTIRFELVAMKNINLYYPNNTNNYLGGLNFLSYFTFLSNIFVNIYFIVYGLSKLNISICNKIADNTYIQGIITTNMIITGVVYCFILRPFLESYPWDGKMTYANIVNFYNHVVTPIIITYLWLTPHTNKLVNKKLTTMTLIFPIIYLIFSLIRGKYITEEFYPYPFLNPQQIWHNLVKGYAYNELLAYILCIFFILLIATMFIITSKVLIILRNKIIDKKANISKNINTIN